MTALQGKRAALALAVAACAVAVAGAATLSDVLSQRPVIAPEVTQEEPAVPAGFSSPEIKTAGCWEVKLAEAELSANWVPACPDNPPAVLGVHAWRAGVVRLPGVPGAEPAMARAQVQSSLSEELAQHGEGALLFLPTTAAGAGYYVAAWSVSDASDESAEDGSRPAPKQLRGYQVGRYGAPPVSMPTPGGRVYLQPDFAPRRALAQNAAQELDPQVAPEAQEPASEPEAATSASVPTT